HNETFRTEPIGYFTGIDDMDAVNTCAGWEPNTDARADAVSGSSPPQPTASEPRGSSFSFGDVIPLDWQTGHLHDLQARLAPNLAFDPLAVPDFRIAPYLQDAPAGAETFLRLKNEISRPLLAFGSTPHGTSL